MCFTSIYDDEGKISGENVFTNTLNVLGWIPIISIIAGSTRMIFANYKLKDPCISDEAKNHYKNHKERGNIENFFGFGPGNLICLGYDVTNAFLLLANALKNYRAIPITASEIPPHLYKI